LLNSAFISLIILNGSSVFPICCTNEELRKGLLWKGRKERGKFDESQQYVYWFFIGFIIHT
ncbi:hypothetical protein ACJX0J_027420, partial [Zea mays]